MGTARENSPEPMAEKEIAGGPSMILAFSENKKVG